MNATQVLEKDFKREFNRVYRTMSYQLTYWEAEILLDLLLGLHVVYMEAAAYKIRARQKEILKIK